MCTHTHINTLGTSTDEVTLLLLLSLRGHRHRVGFLPCGVLAATGWDVGLRPSWSSVNHRASRQHHEAGSPCPVFQKGGEGGRDPES